MLKWLKRSGIVGDGSRFILLGAINSAVTLAAFQLYMFVMPFEFAYASMWLTGLIFVVALYPSQVYRKGNVTLQGYASFAVSYGVVFLLGMLLLKGLVVLGIWPRIAVFLVLAATTVLNFLAGRFLFGKKNSLASEKD